MTTLAKCVDCGAAGTASKPLFSQVRGKDNKAVCGPCFEKWVKVHGDG